MPTSPLLFNILLEILITVGRHRREESEGQENCLFAGDNCLYRNSQGIFKTTTRTNKIIGYKVNIKNQLHFYILAAGNWKMNFKKVYSI